MPVVEGLKYGDQVLTGDISVWDEEAGTNIETRELPGYEGVHIPDLRRGARIVHLQGKVLADSEDDARVEMDRLGLIFGTRELLPLYFYQDRFTLAYTQHWSAGYDEQVATAITWKADLYCPVPLWQSTDEQRDYLELSAGSTAAAVTGGVALACGAPTWPTVRITFLAPGTYLWEWFGANLLRNTQFTGGQNPDKIGVAYLWDSDEWGDAPAYLAYGVPSAARPSGPGFSGPAAGSMVLQGAPGEESLGLWQRVPFLESGQHLSAFAGFRAGSGTTVTLSLQALDDTGDPTGDPVTATVICSDWAQYELAAEGLVTPSDTAAVEWRLTCTPTAGGSGYLRLWLDRPALVRLATAFWPGHSTYTAWQFSGDDLPPYALFLLDCLHHQTSLFLPNVDQDLVAASAYLGVDGQYPVALPLPAGAQFHTRLSHAAGGAGHAEVLTVWQANYWGP